MNNKQSPKSSAKLILLFVAVTVLFLGGWVYFSSQNIGNPINKEVGLRTISCDVAVTIGLGNPYVGKDVAEFTSAGGILYVKSQKFDHTGILTPKRYVEAIYIGPIDKLPNWDTQRGVVTNATLKINFDEGNYGEFKVNAGRYWLWSGGGDVIVSSCDPNGASDPKAVK